MSDEQINAAIAEACGWKGNVLDRDMEGNLWPSYPPRYCTDLNAMHQAEEFLIGNCWIGYVNTLADIEGTLFGIRATARQRAEAFLRAIGKWQATDKESLTVGDATTEESSVDHLYDATKMIKEVQK